MRVVADPPDGFVNKLTWAVYWRIVLMGTVAGIGISFGVGLVSGAIRVFQSGGVVGDPPFAFALTRDLLSLVGIMVAQFFIFRWAIRSRLGQVADGHTLIVAKVTFGKEASDAN